MVDEKVIDGATYVLGAVIGAIAYFAPQIQALYANDPATALLIGIVMMTVTNIGSRFAINQVKQEQPAVEPPVDQGA